MPSRAGTKLELLKNNSNGPAPCKPPGIGSETFVDPSGNDRSTSTAPAKLTETRGRVTLYRGTMPLTTSVRSTCFAEPTRTNRMTACGANQQQSLSCCDGYRPSISDCPVWSVRTKTPGGIVHECFAAGRAAIALPSLMTGALVHDTRQYDAIIANAHVPNRDSIFLADVGVDIAESRQRGFVDAAAVDDA